MRQIVVGKLGVCQVDYQRGVRGSPTQPQQVLLTDHRARRIIRRDHENSARRRIDGSGDRLGGKAPVQPAMFDQIAAGQSHVATDHFKCRAGGNGRTAGTQQGAANSIQGIVRTGSHNRLSRLDFKP